MSQEHSPATNGADAIRRALEYFEQPKKVGSWEYNETSKEKIITGLKDGLSALSETPRKPIAWRWRIVSTDEIPWLYATEKPNNLNDELFWDVEPLFAASVPSATPLSGARVHLEHGWITVRTESGWLLWSSKGSRIPSAGFSLDEVLAEAVKNAVAAPRREEA